MFTMTVTTEIMTVENTVHIDALATVATTNALTDTSIGHPNIEASAVYCIL